MGIYFKLNFKDLKDVQKVLDAFDTYLEQNPQIELDPNREQVITKSQTDLCEEYYKFAGWCYDNKPCVIASKKYNHNDNVIYEFVMNFEWEMKDTVVDYELYNELQSTIWATLNDPYERKEGWEREVCCRLCKSLHDKPQDCSICEDDLGYLNAMVDSLCTLQVGLDELIK
jgi:hypothetical protein